MEDTNLHRSVPLTIAGLHGTQNSAGIDSRGL